MNCPHCGRVPEVHSAMNPAVGGPKPGDVAICWGCRQLAIYDTSSGKLSQRKPTTAEQAELDADPAIQRALLSVITSETPQQALATDQKLRGA